MSAAAANPSTTSNGGESLVSAANLAVVALLKLNRVIAPVILGWVRARRQNWIRRASKDVAKDLRENPGKRTLCVATCCLHTYREVAADAPELLPAPPTPPTPPTPSTPSTPSVPPLSRKASLTPSTSDMPAFPRVSPALAGGGKAESQNPSSQAHGMQDLQVFPEASFDVEAGLPAGQSAASATPARKADASAQYAPSARTPWPPVDSTATSLFGGGVMMTDERYFRLLVLQEEHHREIEESPWLLKSTVWVVTTLALLIVFSAIAIGVVLRFRVGSARENVSFIFTLVATAVVSESDLLIAALKLRKLKLHGDGKDSSTSLDDTDEPDGEAPRDKHADGSKGKHKKDGRMQHGQTEKANTDRHVRPLGT